TTSIYKKEIQDANKFTGVFGQSIFEAGKKFASWLLIGNIIIGISTAIKGGIQSITDIDTALTNLNKVTDETRETLNKFSIEANRVGMDLAKTTVDVINSATQFARLGYSLQQATQLAKQALLYSNVGDIGVEQASLAIISAVKGFGVEVDSTGRNVQKIVDIYNEVGNNFAISSAGIGEAMRRSAASLYAAGNTMEEAVAMITAANSVVQDPAAVGTALKTVSMRLRGVSEDGEDVLEYLPKLEQAFRNVGIEIRKDENTFKSTYELMSNLASIWDTLTDIQRAHMSELVAGKRQGNIVMAMMSNYKDMQDSLTTALNSTNSALIENDKYMESIEARSAQFKNTVMGKWQEALDSNVVKGFVIVMTQLVEIFGNINTILAISTTAFLLWKGTAILGSITALMSFITIESMAVVSTTALTKAFNALKLAMITNPIGLLAVGVTSAIIAFNAYTNHVKKAREENEKLIKTTQSQIQSLKSQKEGLTELSSEYETLKNKEGSLTATTEEKKRLLEIQKELVDNYGVSATGINLEGEAYADSIEAIKLRTLALDAELKKEQELLKLRVLETDTLNTGDIKDSTKKRNKAQVKIERINKILPYFEENDPITAEIYKKQLKELNKEIEDANNIIQTASESRQKYLEYDAQETIKSLESNGKKMSDSAKLVVSEFTKSLAIGPEDIQTQQQSLQDFINEVSNSNLDALIEKYNNFVSAINSGDNSKDNIDGLKNTSEEIINLIDLLIKGNPDLKEFAINFASVHPPTIDVKNAVDSIDKYAVALQNFNKTLASSSKQLNQLKEIKKSISESGVLLGSDIESLNEMGIYAENASDAVAQITKKEEELKEAVNEAYRAKEFADEAFSKNAFKTYNAFFSGLAYKYGLDLNNYKTIAALKLAVDQNLIQTLAGAWAKYFQILSDGSIGVNEAEITKFKDATRASSDPNAHPFLESELANAEAQIRGNQSILQAEYSSIINNLKNIGGDYTGGIPDYKSGNGSDKDQYSTNLYTQALARLNAELEHLQYLKSKLIPTSQSYRDVLAREVQIQKQLQVLASQEADRLRSKISSGSLNQKEIDDAKLSIIDLGDAWREAQEKINDLNFGIVESKIKEFDENLTILTEDL
ncbi:MAG: phage tail tape measure protein, partial [Acholeplasmataceae bacterium]|nr:phage tail tape measure protein [Acholeplasmataceae bacterium]